MPAVPGQAMSSLDREGTRPVACSRALPVPGSRVGPVASAALLLPVAPGRPVISRPLPTRFLSAGFRRRDEMMGSPVVTVTVGGRGPVLPVTAGASSGVVSLGRGPVAEDLVDGAGRVTNGRVTGPRSDRSSISRRRAVQRPAIRGISYRLKGRVVGRALPDRRQRRSPRRVQCQSGKHR